MISTSRICISPKETPEFCYAGFNSLAEKFPASDTVPISSKRHAHGRELCCVVGNHPPGRWFVPDWMMMALLEVQHGLGYQ